MRGKGPWEADVKGGGLGETEVVAGARGRAACGTGSGVCFFDVDSDSSSLAVCSSSEAISSPLSEPETTNVSSSPPSEASSGEDGPGSSFRKDCRA